VFDYLGMTENSRPAALRIKNKNLVYLGQLGLFNSSQNSYRKELQVSKLE